MEQMDSWNEFYRTNRRAWRGMTDVGWLDLRPGMDVLEVGCGNGKTLAALRAIGCRAIGIDFSVAAVESCKGLLPDMDVRLGNVLELEFDDHSFDAVIMFHVLEHILPEDMCRVGSELTRIVKPGGRAYVRSFSVDDMRSEKGEHISDDTVVRGNGIRYRYYSEESLRASFPDLTFGMVRKVEESTRFGTVRSRIEAVIHFR